MKVGTTYTQNLYSKLPKKCGGKKKLGGQENGKKSLLRIEA